MKMWMLAMSLVGALAALTGCDSKGTCEFKYDEASKDGSIPAGLAVCSPDWVPEKCDASSMSTVSLGLKTSGYKFTKGAKCVDIGYKDCSGGRGIGFYRECPH
jgi:hypothetical protein